MSEVKNEIINRLTKLNGTTEVDETSEEIKQISKRFNNGTETIDDILNHCRHYMLKLENGRILDLVEKKYLDTVLNLIEKLQKENEKLKYKNQDLLKKLRNRVKEVKKLTKYSQYKKEFSRLNQIIKEKDKIIDLMAKEILCIDKSKSEYIYDKPRIWMTEEGIKDYYERKTTNNG